MWELQGKQAKLQRADLVGQWDLNRVANGIPLEAGGVPLGTFFQLDYHGLDWGTVDETFVRQSELIVQYVSATPDQVRQHVRDFLLHDLSCF